MLLKSLQFRAETPETGLGVLGILLFFLLACSAQDETNPALRPQLSSLQLDPLKSLFTLNNQHQQSPFSLLSSHSNFFLQKRQLTNLDPFKYWGMRVPPRAVAVAMHHSWMETERLPNPCQAQNQYIGAKFKSSPRSPRALSWIKSLSIWLLHHGPKIGSISLLGLFNLRELIVQLQVQEISCNNTVFAVMYRLKSCKKYLSHSHTLNLVII